ncbi:hypothetical protein M2277_005678 [Paenibacillus sp. LBL]|uniref:hypothetical protein n=1 Tax=Paenibacillus sp. LBL TaxID=2940563 RepID=UPI00247439EC|nr:hypothetical protein [Paenibacillus sp. LBL]MDH6674979.1 hypothetical protein [Paenibacillus sp. LBL]
MQTLPTMTNQSLFPGLKSILNNSELKTFEKMIMIVIKVYQAEYGDVFPDYDTIAAAGGMSKRKAQYVVKDLTERKLIEKKPRFKKLVDGTEKQTSNQYKIAEEANIFEELNTLPVDAQSAHDASVGTACASHAPYSSGFNNQESLDLYPSTELKEEEEELYITRERMKESEKYAQYADVYTKMINDQQTGLLSYKQVEFLDCCSLYNLPACLVNEIYLHVNSAIQNNHIFSIRRTFKKFAERLAAKKIDTPAPWFATTFFNENLKVITEIQLERAVFAS